MKVWIVWGRHLDWGTIEDYICEVFDSPEKAHAWIDERHTQADPPANGGYSIEEREVL